MPEGARNPPTHLLVLSQTCRHLEECTTDNAKVLQNVLCQMIWLSSSCMLQGPRRKFIGNPRSTISLILPRHASPSFRRPFSHCVIYAKSILQNMNPVEPVYILRRGPGPSGKLLSSLFSLVYISIFPPYLY